MQIERRPKPIHRTPRLRGLARVLFIVYLALLLKFVLFKSLSDLRFVSVSLHDILFRVRHHANFTPFKTIGYYLSGHANTVISVQNLVGNILLFIPLGFLVPILRPRLAGAAHVGAVALGTSFLLEVVQLLTGLGGFDVDDLLLNVVGGLIGWLAFSVLERLQGPRP